MIKIHRLPHLISWLAWWIIFFSGGWIPFAAAQPILRTAKLLSAENGLSESTNEFIFKDSQGFVWIGSIDGLNRFDGKQVKVFKPQSGNSHSIKGANIQSPFFEVSGGDLWFTTESAINCYRRNRGNFDHYYIQDKTSSGNDRNYYAFFLEDQHFLWVISEGKLYKLDILNPDQPPTFIAPISAVRCIADADPNGSVQGIVASAWGLEGGGVEYLKFGSNQELIDRYPLSLPKGGLLEAYDFDSDQGKIWMATSHGLVEFEPGKGGFRFLCQNRRIKSVKKGPYPYLMASDLDGHLFWVHRQDGSLTEISLGKEDSNKRYINQLYISPDKIVWYNFNGGEGVYFSQIQQEQFFHPVRDKRLFQSQVSQIFESPNGGIHVLNDDGVKINLADTGKFSTDQIQQYSRFYGSGSEQVWQISGPCLFRRSSDLKTAKMEYALPPECFLFDLANFRSQLLLGANTGLYRYDPVLKQMAPLKAVQYDVLSLLVDQNMRIWTGSGDRLDVWQAIGHDSLALLKSILQTGIVNHLKADISTGFLWAGTANGLLRINLQTLEYTLLNEEKGLPNQYVYAVVPDKKERVWISTNQGVLMIPSRVTTSGTRQFTKRDGLSDNKFCRGAGILDKNGNVWFGSSQGIDMFNPDEIQSIGVAPQLALTSLRIHDKEWGGDSIAIGMMDKIELRYNENTIRLEMAAMEYLDPERNQFKVRLEGADTSWTSLGGQNFISFANLTPGKYLFKFTACNAEGVWQDSFKTLAIIIHPPFWKTWWFTVLLILSFAGILYGLYMYRLRQIKKTFRLRQQTIESEMKALRAQMNPHFIFNSLNSINAYILQNKSKIASAYLSQFAQLIRQILDNSVKDTISLEDEMTFLENYLELEAVRMEQRFEYEISVAGDIDSYSTEIPSMILQLFVENAIWHGVAHLKEGGKVTVVIQKELNGILLRVEDNGVGRLQAQLLRKSEYTSKGLQITTERIKLYDQKYHKKSTITTTDLIKEGKTSGTRVDILIIQDQQ